MVNCPLLWLSLLLCVGGLDCEGFTLLRRGRLQGPELGTVLFINWPLLRVALYLSVFLIIFHAPIFIGFIIRVLFIFLAI